MISFSYNPKIIGKPVRDKTGRLLCDNKPVNLGYGWITTELEYPECFTLVAEGGFAIAPALKDDHRNEDNFLSHQLALVDIDDGMKIEDLMQFGFYKVYGSGFYTTPSHTDEHHKFRIIYRLESPITSAERMRALYRGLLTVHGGANVSCKDSARIFYGSIDSARREITDRFLPDNAVQAVIDFAPPQKVIEEKPTVYVPVQDNDMIAVLDELKIHYPILKYQTRFIVTRAVMGVLGAHATIQEMRMRWPDNISTGKYEAMVRSKSRSDAPSIGTLIHMIKQYNPNFNLKEKTIVTILRKHNLKA